MALTKDGKMINGGRPKKEIDKKAFENLCSLQCTKDEICGFFDVHEETLTRWCHDTYGEGFSDVYKKKSASGKMSLRRMQFRTAEEGNATMQIWLGKQYLGQTDVMRQNIHAEVETSEVVNEVDSYLAQRKKRVSEDGIEPEGD